jgi:hypothetical protein
MHWIKEHPYLSGSLVLVAIILFFVIRRASSGTASASAPAAGGPSEGLLAAQLQASTQLQGATIAATAQQNQVNAQLAAVQVTSAADVQKAQLAQTVALQNIVTGGDVANQANAYNLEAVKAQTGAQVSLADIQAQGALGLAQIQTGGQVAIAGQAAQVNEAQIAANIQEQQIIGATQLGLAQTAADVQKNTTNRQADIAYTELTQAGMTTRNAQTIQGNLDYTQMVQQGQTTRTAITTAGNVATAQTNAMTTVDLQAMADKYGIDTSLISGLNAGQYGNPNRAQLAADIATGTQSSSISGPGNAQSASVWGSFWNFAKSIPGALSGGFGGGGGGTPAVSSTISYPGFG